MLTYKAENVAFLEKKNPERIMPAFRVFHNNVLALYSLQESSSRVLNSSGLRANFS